MENTRLIEKSALSDYACRADNNETDEMSCVDFCVGSRDVQMSRKRETENSRNTRIHYLPPHPSSAAHCRVLRKSHHRHLPSFIGASFPSAISGDTETHELYLSTMLILFKPWKKWSEVVSWINHLHGPFDDYVAHNPVARSRIHNTQLQRDSKEAAGFRNVQTSQEDRDLLTSPLEHLVPEGSDDDGDDGETSPLVESSFIPSAWQPT